MNQNSQKEDNNNKLRSLSTVCIITKIKNQKITTCKESKPIIRQVVQQQMKGKRLLESHSLLV